MGRPSWEEMREDAEEIETERRTNEARQTVALENIDKSLRTIIEVLRKKK